MATPCERECIVHNCGVDCNCEAGAHNRTTTTLAAHGGYEKGAMRHDRPDADPNQRTQGKLLARRQALREDIRAQLLAADEQTYIDLAGRVHDSGEEAVADWLADLNITFINRHVQALHEVERALIRIDVGAYGECRECGGEIGYERLRSYPTAERCVECQALYEPTHAHAETPSL